MTLHKWQEEMQTSILTAADCLSSDLSTWQISREQEIAIYANAYFLRLAEALRTNYPVLHQILGDEDFDAMAKQYIELYPSQHPSIRWFGTQLAHFLASTEPFAEVEILAELAQFEWALRHAIDAADAPRFDLNDLQRIPPQYWGELCFALHPSLQRLELAWNAPQVWQAVTDECEVPAPQAHAMGWLTWRRADLALNWRSASAAELHALNSIEQGLNFAQICEELLLYQDDIGDVALSAAQLLRAWVEQGLIALRQAN